MHFCLKVSEFVCSVIVPGFNLPWKHDKNKWEYFHTPLHPLKNVKVDNKKIV